MAWHVVALDSGSCREAPVSDAHVVDPAAARMSIRPPFLFLILIDIWDKWSKLTLGHLSRNDT